MFNTSTSLFNIKYLLLTVMVLLSYENYSQKTLESCPMDITPEQRRAWFEKDQARKLNGNDVPRSMTRQVPVKLHIIHDDNGNGGLLDEVAVDNITELNNLYSSAQFNFTQCGDINYINNSAIHGILIKSDDPLSVEHTMAISNKTQGALNIFFVKNAVYRKSDGSLAGASWSAFPDDLLKDWIIMRNSQAQNFKTLSHEVGHWFDLLHTFSGSENATRDHRQEPCFNCDEQGDMLCDTPAEHDSSTDWSSTCTYLGTDTDGCGASYNPSPLNLMSYAGSCRDEFTPNQITRMQTSYDQDRASDLHGNNCSDPTVLGCTNPSATNYNPLANVDDGSCIVPGCTDSSADNFNPFATIDNGSCIYYGCTNPNAANYDPTATHDDGSCNIIYCSGTETLTAQSGTFYDGSGAAEYNNNSNCKWLIQPNGINSFVLEFTSFFLEENYDYVRVYDGTTTSAPLLGSFSQFNILPPNLTTSTGAMLVHFTTDGATTSYGWAANYYPITNPCQGDAVVDITSNPIPSGDYFASNKIITSNPTVSNPTINMTAGKSIELTEGFDGVSNGPSVVEMKIEPCVNSLKEGESLENSLKDQNNLEGKN